MYIFAESFRYCRRLSSCRKLQEVLFSKDNFSFYEIKNLTRKKQKGDKELEELELSL